MDAPPIQYAKTKDGVNIAYYALGQGVPFVSLGLPSHLSEEWTVGGEIYEQLAKELRFVRLDPRGFGLSDRDCDDLSLSGFVQDIEAVVDKLELPRFVLLSATPPTTPIAIAFTAAHPDRVARLILSGGAKTPDLVREQFAAILNVPGMDWRSTSESIARIIAGWDDQGAATIRSSANL